MFSILSTFITSPLKTFYIHTVNNYVFIHQPPLMEEQSYSVRIRLLYVYILNRRGKSKDLPPALFKNRFSPLLGVGHTSILMDLL